MSQTEGDPYWVSRHRIFIKEEAKEDADINIKEATKNYATAWSIFAALLMTVSFSLLPIDPEGFYSENDETANRVISYFYMALLLISTICSFLAVLVGTLRYNFFDGVPAPMIMDAVKAIKLPGAQLFVYPSMLAQLLASVIGCYLFLGTGVFVMAILMFFGLFVPGFLYVFWKYKQTLAGIDGLKLEPPKGFSKRDVGVEQDEEQGIAAKTDNVEETNK